MEAPHSQQNPETLPVPPASPPSILHIFKGAITKMTHLEQKKTTEACGGSLMELTHYM